ncbi:hypothetical protein GGTG_04580 [Gaeumannomyces tritici R3-111a-1]|uniref:Uncharacterized protein n=1 Tax=Gaeumannomyces tritici (strain R3-111a-1) TaxID=644352 RepID=J3NTI0_GAET3|nr:hypothetical protein GGTG_04580 [Gaeumannomyces tritici R3-111a-1]EJT79496.1 hypothetical protein GGTG_04580 [Gaeumannomyces tritici R3-111a-1]
MFSRSPCNPWVPAAGGLGVVNPETLSTQPRTVQPETIPDSSSSGKHWIEAKAWEDNPPALGRRTARSRRQAYGPSIFPTRGVFCLAQPNALVQSERGSASCPIWRTR